MHVYVCVLSTTKNAYQQQQNQTTQMQHTHIHKHTELTYFQTQQKTMEVVQEAPFLSADCYQGH